MRYTPKIRKAVRFAINTHEIDQKQKRKGKDIAYITHPMTVALILARAGADEAVVVAGLLHDTIEDCSTDCPVIADDISSEFGEEVSILVQSITEKEPTLPWAERKAKTLEDVKTFSLESVLLKSADVLSNGTEIIDDYKENGAEIFERFNASKKEKIGSQINLISALLQQFSASPLATDLKSLKQEFEKIK